MKPETAAKKLGILLEAAPEEFRSSAVTRSQLAALQADPPEWLQVLRREGPHPRNVVAAKLGISNSGLARGGITEPLTTAEIKALLVDGAELSAEGAGAATDGVEVSVEAADAATDAILAWLDRAAPDAGPIGLLGFSQGGAMALELLRRDPDRFAFAVSLAGFALPGERDGDERMSQLAPHVFWGRGTVDGVIPVASVARTQAWLPAHSTLDERIYEGVGHSVSDRELADVAAYIRAQFATAA